MRSPATIIRHGPAVPKIRRCDLGPSGCERHAEVETSHPTTATMEDGAENKYGMGIPIDGSIPRVAGRAFVVLGDDQGHVSQE